MTKIADKPEAKPEAATPAPVLGDSVFVVAVHGRIIHPTTHADIDTDSPKKVVVDAWYLMQMTAGKLALAF
jgi:hypothetical protein